MNCKRYGDGVLQKAINVFTNGHHYHFLYSSHMALISSFSLAITMSLTFMFVFMEYDQDTILLQIVNYHHQN